MITQRKIEDARLQAKHLGIYKIIKNIATQGKYHREPSHVKWQDCTLKYKMLARSHIKDHPTGFFDGIRLFFSNLTAPKVLVTSITKPDGTVLYRSEGRSEEFQVITDFRMGQWVERITAYSQELNAIQQQQNNESVKAFNQKKLEAFSKIDF